MVAGWWLGGGWMGGWMAVGLLLACFVVIGCVDKRSNKKTNFWTKTSHTISPRAKPLV